MINHQPYEEVLKRRSDFRVRYRFYSQDEGGRYTMPFQGLRLDFFYEHVDHKSNAFIIWPEFEDESMQVILTKTTQVSPIGTARMWIINEQWINYHKERIKVGTTGYFLEGKRIAECEVIELINIG